MDLYWTNALTGLGDGAVIAGVALGLVLAYQGSGVINFAHGAMMMYATYIYDELRDTGDYVFPFSIGGTDRVNVLGTPPDGELTAFWPAFGLAMLTAAVLGLLVHLLVFKPMRGAPVLAKVVATVGIFVVLQSIVLLRFGTQNETVRAILPSDPVNFLGATIPQDRLWLALIVLLTAFALTGLYKLTRFGLATRAAADEEKGAVLLGYSPDFLAAGNWVLASLTAAAFGILAASVSNGVNTVNYTLLVVPALAGALIGAFRSFVVTAVACLIMGMLRSEMLFIQVQDWWPEFARTGMRDAVPFLIIVIVLFIRGDSLPTRGTIREGRHAFAPTPRNVLPATVVLVAVGLIAITVFDRALRLSLYQSMAAAIIALSIVVVTGYIGQVSLAQAVFAGVAGYVVGKVGVETSMPFVLTTLIGALAAAAVGVIIAIPALRVRGIQLAVVTMALGVVVGTMIFSNRWFVGETGALPIKPPELFGVNFAANIGSDFNRWEYGVLLLIVTALSCLLVVNLRRSTTGRQFLAVRANEAGVAAAKVNVAQAKLTSFAVSSFLAGLGGAMLAYMRGQISPDSFSVFVSLTLLAFAYLGGIGLVSGALVAGALAPGGLMVGVIDKAFGGENLDTYAGLVGGVGLILMAILNTDGIAGKFARDRHLKRSANTIARPDNRPVQTMEATT
ncbi:MAG: ABC transporter permease [Acidimicrobiales bacterium]